MRALVTGGAGFIGSHLVDALVERGDDVAVLDNLSKGTRANLRDALARGTTLHEVDLLDREGVVRTVAEVQPDVVFHLAAQTRVPRSIEDPWHDADTNIVGTISVLEAARRAGVQKVVNSSTGGAIYGNAERIPIPEDTAVGAISPYGRSKHAAEGYCELYARLYGLQTVTLRYANVYGPRQDATGEGGVISTFGGRLLSGERPTIFGDGLQTRDFTYVGDVVDANLKAADGDRPGPFNIGRGEETTVLDIVAAFARHASDGAFEPVFRPARPGEVRRSALDATRAREQLGWQPAVDLDTGVDRTLASIAAAAPSAG